LLPDVADRYPNIRQHESRLVLFLRSRFTEAFGAARIRLELPEQLKGNARALSRIDEPTTREHGPMRGDTGTG